MVDSIFHRQRLVVSFPLLLIWTSFFLRSNLNYILLKCSTVTSKVALSTEIRAGAIHITNAGDPRIPGRKTTVAASFPSNNTSSSSLRCLLLRFHRFFFTTRMERLRRDKWRCNQVVHSGRKFGLTSEIIILSVTEQAVGTRCQILSIGNMTKPSWRLDKFGVFASQKDWVYHSIFQLQ